jgi:N-acetylneuraminic acid mutarotase
MGGDGCIYAIGGADGYQPGPVSTVEAYDPMTDTWAAVAPLRSARSLLGAATGPDGRIYAVGGEPDFNAHTVRTVEVYDPDTDRWATVAPMPTSRSAPVVATGSDGRIYVIGGVDWSGVPRRMFFVDAVEAYEPGNRQLGSAGAPSHSSMGPRWNGKCRRANLRRRRHVQQCGAGDRRSLFAQLQYVEAVVDLPTRRLALAAAATGDGRIFAIGGVNQDIVYSDVVEAYSAEDSSWARMAPIPTARGWFAAATGDDGRIYAVGGRGNIEYAPVAALEVYDPVTNCW